MQNLNTRIEHNIGGAIRLSGGTGFAAAATAEVEVSLLTPATDLEALTDPDGVTDFGAAAIVVVIATAVVAKLEVGPP